MNINISKMLLRQRWLLAALIALIIFVYEAIEHFSAASVTNPGFFKEVFIFSVALPLLLGGILTLLAHTRPHSAKQNVDKPQDCAKERVLVVENHLLMGAGLEGLLARETNFEIVGVAPFSEADLIRKIKDLQPTTIILDEATYLTHSIRLLAFLRLFKKLRLVVVNANTNMFQIYHKQNFLLTQADDFIKVLS